MSKKLFIPGPIDVSEDVLVMELIKHIENEWVNYKKAKGDVIWSYSLQ